MRMGKTGKVVTLLFLWAGFMGWGGVYNFHCIEKLEACRDRCLNSPPCIPNGSNHACKACYDRCEEANKNCEHYQNVCAPQFQKCIKESFGDETLKKECRKEYMRCKARH